MAIYFHKENIDLPPLNKKSLKNWIKQVAKLYSKNIGELNYIFTNDEKILEIN
jgi:ssRNA-specific RNase YbeY (16S rRNA maturation enzyme)